jgi:hypothetical protein
MNTISSSGNFMGMAGICLDRLLKQRFALRKPDFSFDFPPPRGGLRSLSVAADCLATKSRALSGLVS